MNISPRRLLLLDGIGAIVTASMCLVLARFESCFGMPREVMLVLSGIAFCFALFSFSSFLYVKNDFKQPLRIISTANFTYCVATFALAIIHIEKLTTLGITYFIGEIIIVLWLVKVERNTLKKPSLKIDK